MSSKENKLHYQLHADIGPYYFQALRAEAYEKNTNKTAIVREMFELRYGPIPHDVVRKDELAKDANQDNKKRPQKLRHGG